MTLYYVFAFVLALAASAFLMLLLRQGRPRDVLSWAGVSLSIALLCASVAVVVLARVVDQRVRQFDSSVAPPQPSSEMTEVGKQAEELAFKLLRADRSATLSSYRGKVVLLNFWATWCAPCLQELPALDRLQDIYGGLGLQVITVSDEPAETLRAFGARLPQHALVAYLPSLQDVPLFYQRGIAFRPVSYLIDREGVVQRVEVGARDYAFFEQLVQNLVQPNLAMR